MFNALSLQTFQRQAPSIFSENSAERTTDKYQHISTIKVIEGLASKGFMPTQATQSVCRLENKKSYAKHMLRFRHVEAQFNAAGLVPEIILINSHDGLSSYRLIAGLYRQVCSNGLMAGKNYDEVRIRHQGDIIGEVIEGTYEVVETSHNLLGLSEKMGSIPLTEKEKLFFAEAAHAIRFEDSDLGKAIEPIKLLCARRYSEYKNNDLFTVFNVVQENLIKGGVRGYTRDKNGRRKRVSTRAVKGIEQDTALNRALWTLAEKMMGLKA
jgi:hypothetical protein